MKRETFTIDDERSKTLRDHCKETGMKMSVVVRMGLDLYFIREGKKKKDETRK
jgi:hypothetical protein